MGGATNLEREALGYLNEFEGIKGVHFNSKFLYITTRRTYYMYTYSLNVVLWNVILDLWKYSKIILFHYVYV